MIEKETENTKCFMHVKDYLPIFILELSNL